MNFDSIKLRHNEDEETLMLKKYLRETEDIPLCDMNGFFAERIDGYEEHMLTYWRKSYERTAELIPDDVTSLLDLGCGTGLELDYILKCIPDTAVTGIDISPAMLARLGERHAGKNIKTVCADYLKYDFGENVYDAAVSVESLHHFTAEAKTELYSRVCRALRDNGTFILCDYFAWSYEVERMCAEALEKRRRKQSAAGNTENEIVHFDTPLTLSHEARALYDAGFQKLTVDDPSITGYNGATIIICKKR